MIPPFDPDGNLPPGIHAVDWAEIVQRYGHTPYRLQLLQGVRAAALALKAAGCQTLYLDGSFVTAKRIPRDYDACWDTTGVDLNLLDPVLKTFAAGRALQKAKYLGELFPAGARAEKAGRTFMRFFQRDKQTGKTKGIILLDLRSIQP